MPLSICMSRIKTGWLMGLVMVLCLQGCQSWRSETEYGEDQLAITASIDKSVYRPEEAMLAKVTLTNVSDQALTVRALDPYSVHFLFQRPSDREGMKRSPVVSNKEPNNRMIQLAPGQSQEYRFILTRLTHYLGDFNAVAVYEPNPSYGTAYVPEVYSEPMQYSVQGDLPFQRDAEGLILEEDAIAIAKRQVNGEIAGAQAVLIEDEMGLYRFWVNLRMAGSSSQGESQGNLISYMVDPYLGHAREAQPFDPELAQDARMLPPGPLAPKSQLQRRPEIESPRLPDVGIQPTPQNQR